MQAWDEFRQEAFGDPYLVWHDGPDFEVFRDRWGADPAGVTRLLISGLEQDDPLAAQSIGELGAIGAVPQTLVDALAHAAPAATGDLAISIAVARHRLTGDESQAETIAGVLLGDDFWGVRLNAAMALAHFAPTPSLIAAGMLGVQADDYLVRYHSANTLLRWAGRTDDISEHGQFAAITDEGTAEQRRLLASGLAGAAAARMSLPQ